MNKDFEPYITRNLFIQSLHSKTICVLLHGHFVSLIILVIFWHLMLRDIALPNVDADVTTLNDEQIMGVIQASIMANPTLPVRHGAVAARMFLTR